jgi:hypothetical protein
MFLPHLLFRSFGVARHPVPRTISAYGYQFRKRSIHSPLTAPRCLRAWGFSVRLAMVLETARQGLTQLLRQSPAAAGGNGPAGAKVFRMTLMM